MLTILPTKIDGTTENGGIGRTKSDNLPPDVTITDAELEHYTLAVELENIKTALVAVCASVGIGSTLGPAISPPTIEANTHDWNPDGLAGARVVVVTVEDAYDLTGIVPPYPGAELVIINQSTPTLTLKYENAGSAAANRFAIAGEADVVLPIYGVAHLWYASTLSRWVVLSSKI